MFICREMLKSNYMEFMVAVNNLDKKVDSAAARWLKKQSPHDEDEESTEDEEEDASELATNSKQRNCPYRKNGCPVMVAACDIENHKKRCYFQMIDCVISECKDKRLLAINLDNHVRLTHVVKDRPREIPMYNGGAKQNAVWFKVGTHSK